MSTILQCSESGWICMLRLGEGVLAGLSGAVMIQAYMVISKDKSRNFTSEDRTIFVLAIGVALVLAAYYLLFE
jgi:hypothetical protein